ncbi:MAG: AraC family transcriptional regulator, partial [Paenibacillaceae bacterium]|nr:AraC family transcriptional regulator [Paenibacillaceae bacterium]
MAPWGGRRIVVEHGDLFCFYPNQLYSYEVVEAERGLRMVWLTLQGEHVEDVLRRIGMGSARHDVSELISPSVEEALDEMLVIVKSGKVARVRGVAEGAVGGGVGGGAAVSEFQLISKIFHLFHLLQSEAGVHSARQDESQWLKRSLDY